MQTTQRVRQAMMDDTTLSTTAKNVKVITREGKVLLMGPVTNEQERSRIQSIAEGVVGAGNVQSELEVTHS
jgi:osmotically-inducible protein OsmY